jgi:hypothetical protein
MTIPLVEALLVRARLLRSSDESLPRVRRGQAARVFGDTHVTPLAATRDRK